MISIKNKAALLKMEEAGKRLSEIFDIIASDIRPGVTTLALDLKIEALLKERELTSKAKGYMGYRHATCISLNDEVVHGIPHEKKQLKQGDLVKVDVCASWRGYCADMARSFYIGEMPEDIKKFVDNAQRALDKGIAQARAGNRLSDISAAIQQEIEREGYGVIRDFAGHGIGKQMHEEPEILNYGKPGKGPILRPGMTFAIEPMTTMGSYEVVIMDDGWTVKTADKSMAMHVEDTVVITDSEPKIITRAARAASVA